MNDLIALAANVALTLSVIIAVVFGIAQARGAARDRRERLSLQALRSFQTREFVELMQYINSHEMPENSDDLTKAPVRGIRSCSCNLVKKWKLWAFSSRKST